MVVSSGRAADMCVHPTGHSVRGQNLLNTVSTAIAAVAVGWDACSLVVRDIITHTRGASDSVGMLCRAVAVLLPAGHPRQDDPCLWAQGEAQGCTELL